MKKVALFVSLTSFALVAALPLPRAHADEFSLDACNDNPNTPPVQALLQASRDLDAHEDEKVRAAVAAVRKSAAADPFLLLWCGSLLTSLKDPAATATFANAIAAANALPKKHGKAAEPIASLYRATALIRMGKLADGKSAIDSVASQPRAYSTYACRFIPAAQALADAGALPAALDLLRAVRTAVPRARSIDDALLELVLRGRDERAIAEAFDAALKAFPGDVEFTVRKANRVKRAEGTAAAVALLEPLIVRGETSPSLLAEYIGLVSDKPTDAQLEHARQLAASHPDVPALTMMVGVVLHNLRRWEESTTYLEKSGALVDKEPRVALYLAVNSLRTPGREQQAAAYVERAARAGRPDPDIVFFRAVVEVRKDPAAAVRDLERYLALTRGRSDARDEHQKQVQQTLDAVAACVAGPDAQACVERDVIGKGRAYAFADYLGGGDDRHAAERSSMRWGDAGPPGADGGGAPATPAGESHGNEAPVSTTTTGAADRALAVVALLLFGTVAFFVVRRRKK